MPTFTTNWSGDLVYPNNFNLLTKFENFVDVFYNTAMWLDALDGINPNTISYSDTQISASFYGGGSMVITGSGFFSGYPTITSMVITTAANWKMTALGTVYGDFDYVSGSITTYKLESPDGRYIMLSGTIDANYGTGTLKQIMYHSAAGDLVLNGNFTYDDYSGAIGGTLTSFKVTDAYGHWQRVSGLALPVTGIDSFTSIDQLVQYLMSGPDVANGDANANVLKGFAGDDTLSGLGGNDVLVGGDGNDTLYGGAGNDTLNGGAGTDSMTGGTGNDVYIVDSLSDVVLDEAGIADTIKSSISYTLMDHTNIENLTLTGTDAIDGTGNSLANMITGNIANNVIEGGGNNDTLLGGAGDDTLYGEAGNDTLNGGAGNDVLDGGEGSDVLFGGSGNDNYIVDSTEDKVYESTDASGVTNAGGNDTVASSIDWTLGAFVENLILTGSAAIGNGNALANVIIGNDLTNTLSGGAGNDLLNGGIGNDTLKGGIGNDTLDGGTDSDVMWGGAGNDTYRIDSADDEVHEQVSATNAADAGGIDTIESDIGQDLGNYAFVENLTLTGTGNIIGAGNGRNNVLKGNSGANTLDGLAGNDTIDGGAGNDIMNGGAGSDTYYVDASDDRAYEYVNGSDDAGGIDKVISTATFSLSEFVENLQLAGEAAIDGAGNDLGNALTGNSAANSLYGGVGNDTLLGGAGDDALYGGADNDTLKGQAGNDTLDGGDGRNLLFGGSGNDTYVVDSVDDKVYESTDATGAVDTGGIDTVEAGISWTLGAFVENLLLQDVEGADNGTGNALANAIAGNSRANILKGGGGADTINGGAGNDTLYGGTGNDLLTGGAGDNVFVFNAALNTAAAPNVDTITDFASGNDKIHLENAIFTRLATGDLTSFASGESVSSTSGVAIQYETDTGYLYYDSNGKAAGGLVKIAMLGQTDHPTLAATDFVVI